MPIITVQVIKGVVLTSDAQKRDLLKKMTDAFISVVGDVARPYTYCIIQETPLYEWSIGGQPLPDLPFLYGPEYAAMHAKANDIMRSYVASQSGNPPPPSTAYPGADVSAAVAPGVGRRTRLTNRSSAPVMPRISGVVRHNLVTKPGCTARLVGGSPA